MTGEAGTNRHRWDRGDRSHTTPYCGVDAILGTRPQHVVIVRGDRLREWHHRMHMLEPGRTGDQNSH